MGGGPVLSSKMPKGEFSLNENVSVVETDISDAAVPSSLFVITLAQDGSRSVDLLLIADEHSSHCAVARFDPLDQPI